MKNRAIHISNLAQFIGYTTSLKEAFREKPFQLSSAALSNIADRFDYYLEQMLALQKELIDSMKEDLSDD